MALIGTDEVRRLFQTLVEVLAERDPRRLQAPFQVAELYQEIIPYRAHRARLRFDTNQDYEAAVLGLLAGIGGFATVEPPEAQQSLAAEADSTNPDLGLFREFAGARVRLNAARVRELQHRSDSYAPPDQPDSTEPADQGRPPVFLLDRNARLPEPAAAEPQFAADQIRCRGCGETLPVDRPVVFCPWCGKAVGTIVCSRCGDELDQRWRFCPRCGTERRP